MKQPYHTFLIRCACAWLALGFLVMGLAHAKRVVSLVPSTTEILFAIGCQDVVAGLTHHDTRLPGAQDKAIVGGFFSPSLKRIKDLMPDMLIVAHLHTRIREHFEGSACRVLVFDTRTLEEGNRILLLTNMALTPGALTQAVISATEAKTAALWDMDIRSSYTPRLHGATGTGTDNIIVVQGQGNPIDGAGGHTKMGELIASAVYAGVQEALLNQNGLAPERDIFKRLEERRMGISSLFRSRLSVYGRA